MSLPTEGFSFEELAVDGHARRGRFVTPRAVVETPVFMPVGTKASVKSLVPEEVEATGARLILANTYHLWLRPGAEVVGRLGGVTKFMGWPHALLTDSGGFQVFSLSKLNDIDDDGVTFKSHLDGSMHRFTPEISMQVQHQIGADIIFAFDECTTLMNTRGYQERSLERTAAWARRCVTEHRRLTQERSHRPYQALFGVIQGAQYEDLRRSAARDLAGMGFDGFGIGGALEKEQLGEIVGWVTSELPSNRPRHLLGIGEPDDLFTAIENGADTFDCVTPS